MAKLVADAVLDAALNYIKNNAILEIACKDTPTTYANAVGTTALADVAIDGDDMIVADGTVNGRKVTIGEQAAVLIDASGIATHIALCSADTFLYATTCTPQELTAANTVTIPSWKIELGDPAA